MSRPLVRLHRTAGVAAGLIILVFLTVSALSELNGDPDMIRRAKTAIAWGLIALVPALMITGASGMRLGKGWKGPAIAAKKRRMALVAANGMLILVPSALALAWLARQGETGAAFAIVQTVEFLAGGTNLLLIGLNARDGIAMTRRRTAGMA
ncbi:MAG: hypothetical protein U9P68_10770 [Pseudomonadota bacterium]|nr:hypothetical protein [Pseudomonadota bacterium]